MTFDEFVHKKLPGTLLFARVSGSHGANLNVEGSDMDFFGVYAGKTRDILSLDPPPETMDGTKPDFTIHEVGKFCRLLLKGNPTLIESLWADHLTRETEAWQDLKAIRKKLLSVDTVKQYLGYTQGQLHKMAAKGLTPKYGAHLIRLLTDAKRIADGGEPVVWKEGSERDLLLTIRSGTWTQSMIEDVAKTDIADIDASKPWKVQEKPDREALNEWLLGIRGSDWFEEFDGIDMY